MAGEKAKLKVLTAADILSADDREKKLVDCPEWGGVVYVRQMSAGDRDQYEQMMLAEANGDEIDDLRARLVAFTCVDENGVRLFDASQIKALSEKNANPIDRIINVVKRFNLLMESDIEDTVKN